MLAEDTDSSLRDKGLYYPLHSTAGGPSSLIALVPLFFNPTGVIYRDALNTVKCVTVEQPWVQENPHLKRNKQSCLAFSLGREILSLLFWSGNKCALHPRWISFSVFQDICNTNILEKIVQHKSSEDKKKCRRPMENCLSIVWWGSSWLSNILSCQYSTLSPE